MMMLLRSWLAGLLLCLLSATTIASMPVVKVLIKPETPAPGDMTFNADIAARMYTISGADLSTKGIDIFRINPRNLLLRHKGTVVAIRVIGEEDGVFNSGDRIIFYAAGIGWDDPLSELTDTNVYWLEESPTPGARMIEANGSPGSASVPLLSLANSTRITDHIERDDVYIPGVNFPFTAERWFMAGPVQAGYPYNTVSLDFALSQDVDITQSATITVHYQGATDTAFDPDHHSQITVVNACVINSGQTWNGFAAFVQSATIPAGCLNTGNNTVSLYNVGDTGAIVDGWYVDSLDLQYQQASQTTQDVITFNATPPVAVNGFSTGQVAVYAITDPAKVRYLNNPVIAADADGYRVSFADPDYRPDIEERYQVLSVSQYQFPVDLIVDETSLLKSTHHAVDYIMISHPELIDSLQPLAEHRRADGFRVEVVDVTDIYDEFSAGLQTDQAIKDFLSYAYYNWQVKPAYVLLFGDATVSFKNVFSDQVPTYIPTHFYRAYDGSMMPSDAWFVTVDGDDPLPDMFIGRLPVTPANATIVVQKIIGYDQPVNDTRWMREVVFIADNDKSVDEDISVFEEVSNEMAGILSPQYNINKVYLGQVNLDRQGGDLITDKRNAVVNHLKNGNVITTYAGHGTARQWAAEGLFYSKDVDKATNPDRLTFMVALNCLSGYFVRPTNDPVNQLSLAEAFVTSSKGGAVAAWAASYLGFTSDHRVIAKKLFSSIKQQGSRRLGAVTTEARIQALADGASEDTLDSYIFFGDPATALASQRITGSSSSSSGGGMLWLLVLLLSGRVLLAVVANSLGTNTGLVVKNSHKI
jgi:hypothetical protein